MSMNQQLIETKQIKCFNKGKSKIIPNSFPNLAYTTFYLQIKAYGGKDGNWEERTLRNLLLILKGAYEGDFMIWNK